MDETQVKAPIYLIVGFLDGGKTSFLNFTIGQEYFQIDETTLLIVCEQGEEEYDEKFLLKHNTVIEYVEDKEDLTPELLEELEKKYRPERVIIEYNAMWGMKDVEEMEMPAGWAIVQEIAMVDATRFQLYASNMKALFMDMFRNADMVSFNRCSRDLPLSNYRRSIKVLNPGCEIIFEDDKGELVDIASELPYDMNAKIIEIEDIDYGIFYIDAGENEGKYQDKIVRFRAQVSKSNNPKMEVFVPGRRAMTCCADDISFIGFLCKSKYAKSLKSGDWIFVTAKINYEKRWEYGNKTGPVLYALKIEKAQKPDYDLVMFS